MESLIEKAKKNTVKMFNKISDEINRNKWDKSQVNMALFEDAESTAKEESKTDLPVLDFEKQVKEYKSNLEESKVDTKEESKTTDIPVKSLEETIIAKTRPYDDEISSEFDNFNENEQVITEVEEVTLEDLKPANEPVVTKREEDKPEEVKSDIAEKIKEEPIEEKTKEDTPTHCYYVHITRTKDYPAPGSEVVIRSCDSERVWTSEEDKEHYPNYIFCPHCGLSVEFLTSEITD